MTACPIRYQRQVPDRKGKIFYTSITSLSHISKVAGRQAARRGRRRGAHRHYADPASVRSARLSGRNDRGTLHHGASPKGGFAGKWM